VASIICQALPSPHPPPSPAPHRCAGCPPVLPCCCARASSLPRRRNHPCRSPTSGCCPSAPWPRLVRGRRVGPGTYCPHVIGCQSTPGVADIAHHVIECQLNQGPCRNYSPRHRMLIKSRVWQTVLEYSTSHVIGCYTTRVFKMRVDDVGSSICQPLPRMDDAKASCPAFAALNDLDASPFSRRARASATSALRRSAMRRSSSLRRCHLV
jgi:hypothetical protein